MVSVDSFLPVSRSVSGFPLRGAFSTAAGFNCLLSCSWAPGVAAGRMMAPHGLVRGGVMAGSSYDWVLRSKSDTQILRERYEGAERHAIDGLLTGIVSDCCG